MSMTVGLAGAPTFAAVRGGQLQLDLQIAHSQSSAVTVRVRVLGTTEWAGSRFRFVGHARPGGDQVRVVVDVPDELPPGEHAIGLEVLVGDAATAPVLIPLKVSIGAAPAVVMRAPPQVRGWRRVRFKVALENRHDRAVAMRLAGSGEDVDVRVDDPDLTLQPNETATRRVRLRGPRRWGGERLRHVVSIEARNPGWTTSAPVRFEQRPALPTPLVALVAVVLLTLGGVLWWTARDEPVTSAPEAPATTTTTVPEVQLRRTTTAFFGSVTTSDGSPVDDTVISVEPIEGAAAARTTVVALGAGRSGVSKLWPMRSIAPIDSGVARSRETTVVERLEPEIDEGGVWKVEDVELRQNWEVRFALAGFNTERRVVSPTDEGDGIQIDVELQPGTGAISGTTNTGGVLVTATDGDVTLTTRSSTDEQKTFGFDELSTPGTYTLTFSKDGFGTEVVTVPLEPDQHVEGVDVTLVSGVGSISGLVGLPEGVVASVVATAGDDEYRTTTSTEVVGGVNYRLPRLPILRTPYTVTVTAPGFEGASQTIVVDGNERLDFPNLRSLAGAIAGRVVDGSQPVRGALVTLTRDDAEFRVATSATMPGEFRIDGLPAGEYVLSVNRYNYLPYSSSVTITAGQTLRLADIDLDQITGQNSTVRVQVQAVYTDETGEKQPVSNAEITLSSPHYGTTTRSMRGDLAADFGQVAVGTYRITAVDPTGDLVRASDRVTVGGDQGLIEIWMRRPGPVSITVRNPFTPDAPLQDYQLVLEHGAGGSTTTITGQVKTDSGVAIWESDSQPFDGTWRVVVKRQPGEGYFVERQQLDGLGVVDTSANEPMEFTIDRTSPSRVKLAVDAVPYPEVEVRLFTADVDPANQPSVVPLQPANGQAVAITCEEGSAPLVPDGAVYRLALDASRNLDVDEDGDLGACSVSATADSLRAAPADIVPGLQLGSRTSRYVHRLAMTVLEPTHVVRGTIGWAPDTDAFEALDAWTISARDVIAGFPATQVVNGTPPTPAADLADVDVTFPPGNGSTADLPFVLSTQALGTSTYTVAAGGFGFGTFDLEVPTAAGGPLTAGTGLAASPIDDGDPSDLDFSYRLVLDEPQTGTIGGCLTIETGSGVFRHAETTINADQPRSDSLSTNVRIPAPGPPEALPEDTPVCRADPSVSSFSIPDAPAGDWEIAFVPPSNHVEKPAGEPPRVFQLLPGERKLDLAATFVEQGSLDVTVLGDDGASQLPLDAFLAIAGGLIGDTPRVEAVGPSAGLITMIPVSLDSPLDAQPYRLELREQENVSPPRVVTFGGVSYDLAQAIVTVDGVPYDPDGRTDADGNRLSDARSIDVGIASGDVRSVVIVLPRLGSRTSHVQPVLWRDFPETTVVERVEESMDAPETTEVQYCRRFDLAWNAIAGDDCRTTGLDASGNFTLSGLDGFYQVTLRHDLYESNSVVPATEWDGPTGAAPSYPVYRVQIKTTPPLGDFEVRPLPARLSVTVLSDPGDVAALRDPVVVPGATVTLQRSDGALVILDLASPFYGFAVDPGFTGWDALAGVTDGTGKARLTERVADPNGALELTGLPPTSYSLEVTSPAGANHYPVTLGISLPRGPDAAERVLHVTAVSPVVGGRIDVKIFVVSSSWDGQSPPDPSFLLPIPDELLTVDRAYAPDPSSATAGAGSVPASVAQDLTPATEQRTAVLQPTGDPDVPPVEATASFTGLPGGDHLFGKPTGEPGAYQLIRTPGDAGTVTLSRSSVETLEVAFVYQVSNVAVTVTPVDGQTGALPSDIGWSATLALDGTTIETQTTLVGGRFVFSSIVPRSKGGGEPCTVKTANNSKGYTVAISSQLHAATTARLDIAPITGPGPVNCDVAIDAVKGILAGDVTQDDGPTDGGVKALASDKPIEIRNASNVVVTDPLNTYDGSGAFRFFTSSAGQHTVTVNPGADTAIPRSAYTDDAATVAVTLGRVASVPALQIQKRAQVQITLQSPPTGTTVGAALAAASPPTLSAAKLTSPANTWQLLLDPGTNHWLVADPGDSYHFGPVPPFANPVSYGVGETVALGLSPTIALPPRRVVIDVSRSTTGPDDPTATVEVLRASGAAFDGPLSEQVSVPATGTPARATFETSASGPSVDFQIDTPARVRVTSPGYRTYDMETVSTQSVPTDTKTVVLHPLATLTGSVGVVGSAGAPVVVTATPAGGSPIPAALTTNGAVTEFRFDDVLQTGSWTLRVSQLGTGYFQQSFEVRSDDVVGSGSIVKVDADTLTANSVTLTARTINITVTRQGGGEQVVSATTTEAGMLTYGPYTAVLAGFMDTSVGVTLAATDPATASTVTVVRSVAMAASPVISGTIAPAGGTGDNPTTSNTVVVLTQGACSVGNPTTIDDAPTLTAGGAANTVDFDFGQPISVDGTYCIVATVTGTTARTGRAEFTVATSAGTATVTQNAAVTGPTLTITLD